MHCHYASTNTLFRVTRSLLLQRSSCGLRALSSFRSTPPTFMNAESLPYHLVVGLPALSPTMEVGTLAEWYVQAGDSFSAGDALAKIETDKAAMDFEAQDDGVVAKLLVPAGNGADIPISTPIMITVEDAADVAAFANYVPPAAAAAAVPPPPVAAVPPTPAPVAAAVAPPPPVAAAVAPPVAAVAPPPVAAPAPIAAVAAVVSVRRHSPIFATLAAQQLAYEALYGTTGMAPLKVGGKE